jgi:hypothetical protein
MTRYVPANSFETPRFSGVRTFMRLPNSQDLDNSDAAIVGAPFDTATSPSASGTMMWSVTAQVRSMYSSGNYGFLIRDAAEGSGDTEQQFHSLEKAPDRPPQLVITLN